MNRVPERNRSTLIIASDKHLSKIMNSQQSIHIKFQKGLPMQTPDQPAPGLTNVPLLS